MNIEWQVQNLTNTANYTGIGTLLPCGTRRLGVGNCLRAEAPGASFSPFGHVTSAGAMRTMGFTVRFNL